jgi:hypothetical protein
MSEQSKLSKRRKKHEGIPQPGEPRKSGTSYFDDNQQYNSEIINYILEEVDYMRSIGSKLSVECNKIQNSIDELNASKIGLSDVPLLKRIENKLKDLTSNLDVRNKVLNDYNSLSSNELSVFISDRLIGNDVVQFDNSVKNKMDSISRYTDGIINHSKNIKDKLSSDVISVREYKNIPDIPNKSKIPTPKNSRQVDEITLLVKKFIQNQNLHKDRLLKAFESINSTQSETNR